MVRIPKFFNQRPTDTNKLHKYSYRKQVSGQIVINEVDEYNHFIISSKIPIIIETEFE